MIEIVGRSLLAFVMLAAPVNAAAAEWSSVATIAEDASTPLIFPTVAMDSSGNALVAWLGPESMVHVAERAAGQTTWQQRGAVSQAGASDVVAALAADGGALVAWARAGNVEFAYRPAGGSFAAPIPISGAGPSAAHVQTAFDPQGNAFFTFNYVPTTDHVLGWSVRTTTGVVGAVQDFDPTVSADSAARLGFGASGEGIAAWDGVDFGFGYHLGALIRPAGAAFGLGIAIQSDMNPLTTPDLAVGTDGRAVIADIEAGEIHLLLRPAGGNVGTFVSGDIPVFTFGVPETPQVGLLSDGTALIAWKRSMALEWKTYSTGLVLGQTMGVLGAAPEIDLTWPSMRRTTACSSGSRTTWFTRRPAHPAGRSTRHGRLRLHPSRRTRAWPGTARAPPSSFGTRSTRGRAGRRTRSKPRPTENRQNPHHHRRHAALSAA